MVSLGRDARTFAALTVKPRARWLEGREKPSMKPSFLVPLLQRTLSSTHLLFPYSSHTEMLVSPTLPICNSHTLLSYCSCSGDGHQADAVLQTVFLKIKKSLPGPSEFWDVKFKRLLWSRWEPWQQMLTLAKAAHRIETWSYLKNINTVNRKRKYWKSNLNIYRRRDHRDVINMKIIFFRFAALYSDDSSQ